MRKTLIETRVPSDATTQASDSGSWLDLDELATVEITSEDPRFPIDHALGSSSSAGWRAAAKGPQVIRINFDKPTVIRRIHLKIADPAAERSQEFSIHARGEDGAMREIIRQQYSFSPGGSSEEIDDYTVDLAGVITIELRIDPDRAHDPTRSQHFAVLTSFRLA